MVPFGATFITIFSPLTHLVAKAVYFSLELLSYERSDTFRSLGSSVNFRNASREHRLYFSEAQGRRFYNEAQ